MRYKGLLAFDSLSLSPSARAMLAVDTDSPPHPEATEAGNQDRASHLAGASSVKDAPRLSPDPAPPQAQPLSEGPSPSGRAAVRASANHAAPLQTSPSQPETAPHKTIDRFAELLAQGLSVTAASVRLGKQPAYGQALLGRIRKRLGDQAC